MVPNSPNWPTRAPFLFKGGLRGVESKGRRAENVQLRVGEGNRAIISERKSPYLFFFPFYLFFLNFILFFNFTILYWFCHISKWIRHRYTCVPHPEPSSLFPPHTILLGRPSAPAPRIQYRAWNLDWRLVSYMILYMFQCHSPKSSHPLPLPQSPKDCSIHQCLFCCLIYRVIVIIFLNSIYMR